MNILDWSIMKNGAEELMKKKVVLYGASTSGERLLMFLKCLDMQQKIICVSDTDESKWGKKWNNFIVKTPIEICNLSDKDAIIVICSSFEMEIHQYLTGIGCKYNVIGSKAYIHAFHNDLMNKEILYFPNEIVERYKKRYALWQQLRIKYIDMLERTKSNEIMQLLLRRENCILVHSMHKTGNVTLRTSLAKYSNAIMSRHLLCESKREKEILSQIIEDVQPKIRILTGVRYPIERIVSRKWQYLHATWTYGNSYPSLKINSATACLPDPKFGDTVEWFRNQIEELFGIDVFQYPFNIDKGYTIIHKDNISIFLYRLDYLNTLEKEIGDFIGYDDFKIVNDNQSEKKAYALAYHESLKEIEIDSEYFESLISSKEMHHFFSEDERKMYRKKWLPYLR